MGVWSVRKAPSILTIFLGMVLLMLLNSAMVVFHAPLPTSTTTLATGQESLLLRNSMATKPPRRKRKRRRKESVGSDDVVDDEKKESNDSSSGDYKETTTTVTTTATTGTAWLNGLRRKDQRRIRRLAAAKTQDGNPGYVHNATYALSRIWAMDDTVVPAQYYSAVCAPPGLGPEGPNGYKALTEIIQTSSRPARETNNNNNNNNVDSPASSYDNNIRVFCAMYTYEGRHDRVQGALETWAKRCNGFLAASTATNTTLGTVQLRSRGKEGSYGAIWQKVRAILAHLYLHHLDDYDFFHICGDDTFILLDNLRAFVSSEQVVRDAGGPGYPKPLYMGHWVATQRDQPPAQGSFTYAGGGPGYTLSRRALQLFVEKALLRCEPLTQVSFEDLMVGYCLRTFVNVTVYDTRGLENSQRYFGIDPELAVWFHMGRKEQMARVLQRAKRNLMNQYHHKLANGPKSVSTNAVAFHWIKSPAKMWRMEKLLYRQGSQYKDDCSCGGSAGTREPGYVVSTELAGHADCVWDYKNGGYDNCSSYNQLMQQTKEEACNNNNNKMPNSHVR